MNEWFGRLASGRVARASLLLDLLLLFIALWVSAWWSGTSLHVLTASEAPVVALMFLAWLVTSMALRHYDPWAGERALLDDLAMTSILVLAVTTTLAIGRVVVVEAGLPGAEYFLCVFGPTALLLRLAVFRAYAAKDSPVDQVLVVGSGAMGLATAEAITKRHQHEVLGHVRLTGETVSRALQGRTVGHVNELQQLLETMAVAEVYFASTAVAEAPEVQAALHVCERLGVPFALPAYSFRLERSQPLEQHAVHDGYLHYQSVADKPTQRALKRVFDIVASAVALWLLVPLFLVVAIAIKATSRGPLLFRQRRVGLHGRPFNMLKFRTMVVDAEAQRAALEKLNEVDGPVFKIKQDPRVTKVGRFLRKFSIDELPQLVNVLRGDMSIVGPRPPIPSEVAKYETWQRRRLSVRPGLTCIWAVSGRNGLSFEQWMYLDMLYIDTWSLGLDLSLILKTVPVVLLGKGAS